MGSPIFQVRGTALNAYHARQSAAFQACYASTSSPIAVVASADTGIFGGSVIQKATTTVVRAPWYAGLQNWSENPTFSFEMTIVPRTSSAPTGSWYLFSTVGADGISRSGPQIWLDTDGKLNCAMVDKYGTLIGSSETGASAITLVSGTAIKIGVTFSGTTLKFWVNGVVTDTFTGFSVTTRDNTNVTALLFGAVIGDSATKGNYDINEINIWNDEEDLTPSATRTDFWPSTAFDGSNNIDPGIAEVNYLQSYMINGVALVGTKRDTSPSPINVRFGSPDWYSDSVLMSPALVTLDPATQRYLPDKPVKIIKGETVQFLIPLLTKGTGLPVDTSTLTGVTCNLRKADNTTLSLTMSGGDILINQGQTNEVVVNLSADNCALLEVNDASDLEIITVDSNGDKIIYDYEGALQISAPLF